MGLFSRKPPSMLPLNVVAWMEHKGQRLWWAQTGSSKYDPFELPTDSFDPYTALSALSPDAQRSWVTELAAKVLPAGGWAVYGATDAVECGLMHSDALEIPAYVELYEASLQFQRSNGVWWTALSPAERSFWDQHHPNEVWLDRREPPSRDDASITPIPLGQERKLTVLADAPDSKATYVVHGDEGTYVWCLEYPDDEGNRVRDARTDAHDLYELYFRTGQSLPFPGVWVDEEFEPFLPYPIPRI